MALPIRVKPKMRTRRHYRFHLHRQFQRVSNGPDPGDLGHAVAAILAVQFLRPFVLHPMQSNAEIDVAGYVPGALAGGTRA